MVNRILVSLLFVLFLQPAYGAVSAQLSAQDIDELESVRLTIRASETRQTETLDLSHLERDFHVMGTNTSSQYRFRNGREQSWVDYQITLQPKRTGVLQIPSIKVGRDDTPELTLRVRALSSETRDKIKELVFFETELSSSEVYVQAQVVFTRRLLYSEGVQLYSDLPGAPELPNAVVLTLGETSAGSVRRDGKVYGVVEQRYAIFPEASGRLILPSISVTASVRLVENNRYSRKGVRIGTSEAVIYVLPVPAGYPSDQPWLPAEDVTLHQELDATGPVNVGDTLTHELLVHIKGNVGSIAPPIEWTVADDELRTYPQSPVIHDDTNADQVTGARLQTTSVVPLQPGTISIPPQEVYWWNTQTNELAVTRSTALSLTAHGQAITQTDSPLESQDAETQPEAISPAAIDWSKVRAGAPWVTAALLLLIILYAVIRLARASMTVASRNTPKLADATLLVKNAKSPGELINGIAMSLASTKTMSSSAGNRQAALTKFRAASTEHAEFLKELELRAYSDNAREIERADIKQALTLVQSAAKSPTQGTKQSPLPPLYDWQLSR